MIKKIKFRTPLFLIKIFNYEYWAWWFFYIPILPYWLYLAAKSRSLTYFTATNPSIESGGFFGESKINILNKISDDYKPKTIFIEKGTSIKNILDHINLKNIAFPLIAKPNIGERGFEVEKINSKEDLLIYVEKNSNDFIIQEFINYEIEMGVMYYRMPNEAKGKVTSITLKQFLSVTGDGQNSIIELLQNSDRARFQIKNLKKKYGDYLNSVLEKDLLLLLEPIGNHCKGTMFLNGNHLINEDLHKVFNNIAANIDGFYYGRFDMKVKSIDNLYEGKNIKIVELNGVSAEPAHIYDPAYKLINAYSDLIFHWKIIYNICLQNIKNGHKPISGFQLYTLLKEHFLVKSKAHV